MAVTNLNAYPNIFPCGSILLLKGYNPFNNLIIALKLPRWPIKKIVGIRKQPLRASWYSEFFGQNLWRILVKEFIFGNVARYACSFTKKKFFLWHFSWILLIDSVDKTIEQLFWRKPFHLCQQFREKTKVNILKV